MNDALGDRMKAYEAVTKQFLPRRTYTIIRADGKAFHSYTKGLRRPYDPEFMEDMDHTAIHMCKVTHGAVCAYVQSDEISLLLADFKSIHTESWFGGSVQKMASISAATATWMFNRRRFMRPDLSGEGSKVAIFDARVFTIPDPTEVYNYFVWRQKDATRNSISSAAQYRFSSKELHGLSSDQMQELLFQKCNINWNDYPVGFKRGRLITKVTKDKSITLPSGEVLEVEAKEWEVVDTEVFTASKQIQELIPLYE